MISTSHVLDDFRCTARTRFLARRRFLKAAGVLALGGILEACGGGSPAASIAASGTAGSQAASASTAPKAVASAAASAAAATTSATASGARLLRVGYGGPVSVMAPLWMADATHAYANHGLSVTMRLIQGGATIPALIAGDVDLFQISAGPVITADLNGNADLVFIASALNHATFALYALPSITNAADLKGKVVASDKPGQPSDYALRVALSLLGVKTSEVSILPIGAGNVAFPAMETGQVQASMLAPPESFHAQDKGYRMLQDIFSQPYQNIGIVALRSRLTALAPLLPDFLAAYRQGILDYNSQPDVAMTVIQKYTKETDPATLKRSYEFQHTAVPYNPSLQPTMKGLQAMIDFLAPSLPPTAKNAKPAQFVDTRFLAQLPKA